MSSQTEILAQIRVLDQQFSLACKQVKILNSHIEDAKLRYDRARRDAQRGFRSSLRLRMASIEGVRNMMYEYASRKCEEIEDLQSQLMAGLHLGDDFDEGDIIIGHAC